MEEILSQKEIKILKKICENPIWKQQRHFKVEKPSTLKALRLDICSFYDISEELFLSQRRDAHIVKARIEYVHHASKILRCNSSIIADSMNRDKTSILHYLKKPSAEVDSLLQSYNDSGEND